MKTLKRTLVLATVCVVIGLSTSCTEQEFNEDDQQIKKTELTEESV